MPASQANAQTFNPNALTLVRVATYARSVDAPLKRAWENVLDWEHLPHLHASTFDYVELEAAGTWGWRTWSSRARTDHIELTVADGNNYVARSYQGGRQVSEIWTRLVAVGEQTEVSVEFYFPDIATDMVEALGAAVVAMYTRLWDEDESMMCQRHSRLHERRDNADTVDLGDEESLLKRLRSGEKILFQLHRNEYQVREHAGGLIAHSVICPHLLGPLEDAGLEAGKLRCPWHGYEFDLASGECVFPPGAGCRLAPAAALSHEDGRIIARL